MKNMQKKVSLSQICYMTRGKDWDYRYVVFPKPDSLFGFDYFDVEASGIFPDRDGQQYFKIMDPDEEVAPLYAVSAKIKDKDGRVDKFMRPVFHQVAVFSHEFESIHGSDFCEKIVDELSSRINEFYAQDADAVKGVDFTGRFLSEFSVDVEVAQQSQITQIKVKKK